MSVRKRFERQLTRSWLLSFDSHVRMVPAGIGSGASLEEAAGIYLVRHFVGFSTILDTEQLIKFLAPGSPIGCRVGTTVGVALWKAGIPAGHQYLFDRKGKENREVHEHLSH